MLYVTYNDAPSGIYYSQVTDVCKFISEQQNTSVKLLAFISLRGFLLNRKKIKANYAAAIVVPMFPKARFWRINTLTLLILAIITNERQIMARGVFACNMALYIKKIKWINKVIFDARGAYFAELTEYHVIADGSVKQEIAVLEEYALKHSDFRLAVSQQLVNYWNDKYNYSTINHTVIPCTLNTTFLKELPSASTLHKYKQELGFNDFDILVTYSGSSAGWQSFDLIDGFLNSLLIDNQNVKVVFLAQQKPTTFKSYKQFSDRFLIKWLNPEDVYKLLICCDYGIIIREQSITNKVASPVKFAEYLACGLDVLISEQIGDYTAFVAAHQCGLIVTKNTPMVLNPVPYEKKVQNNLLALTSFSKLAYKACYIKLLT